MKTQFFILPLFCFSTLIFTAQSVSYTVDDHTQNLSPFKISLTLMALDNISPQYGLMAQGALRKSLGYHVCFRRNLAKFLFIADKDIVANPEDIKTTNYFEAGVDCFFSERTSDGGRVKVTVDGNQYMSRYFMASVKKRFQTGVHGGVLRYNKAFFSASDTTSEGNITLENDKGKYKPLGMMYGTNSNNIAIFAGFVFKKTKKATIHSDGWKYFQHMGRRIYLDALVGFTSFKDVNIKGASYEAKASKSSPIGYRIGFEWDQMGCVTGFEIGMRPGVQYLFPFYNYWNLNFSFNLFGGDKRYGMRSKN